MSFARYQSYTTALFSGTLIDENGVAVPISDINSLTLTLTDAMTGLTINGRSAQNVLNSNNVTVNNTTGAVNWSIQIADTTPASTTTSYREHVAEFVCTYQSTKIIKVIHRMRVICYLSLAALEDIETFLGVIDETDQPFIEMLLEQFASRAETECDRHFMRKVNEVEYFSPDGNSTRLSLRRYPVESVLEVAEDVTGMFTNAYTYDPTLFGIIANEGIIKLRTDCWLAGEQSIRVTYTGGLARDCGGVPMDLRFACIRQVVFWFQRRKNIGLVSVTVARGGKEVLMPDLDLLPDVAKVLANYRKVY